MQFQDKIVLITGGGTGVGEAAAAAFAGYLRDLGWPHDNHVEIAQGDDMEIPSRIRAEFSSEPHSSIRISGTVRRL